MSPRDAMRSVDWAVEGCLSVCHILVLCQNGSTYQFFYCQ